MENQSSITFLPAMHGDALFLHCHKDGQKGIIIVDGGPSGNATKNPFVREIENLPQKDLMILTHFDNDHLWGIKSYIKKHRNDEHFPVRQLWVNCARHIDFPQSGELSAPKASSLADMLNEISKRDGIIWKPYITEALEPIDLGYAVIDVLNPNVGMLEKFIPLYEQEAKVSQRQAGLPLGAGAESRAQEDIKVELSELAKREKVEPKGDSYRQMANMVSISFVYRCDGLIGLLLGDSFPLQIIPALERRGFNKEHKLKVDFVKVSHHGSRNNISNELLEMIDCKNYLISTNGGNSSSCHPDREAMANILCHEGRNFDETVHLYFNYSLAKIASRKHFELFRDDEAKIYNFEIHEPNETQGRYTYQLTFT